MRERHRRTDHARVSRSGHGDAKDFDRGEHRKREMNKSTRPTERNRVRARQSDGVSGDSGGRRASTVISLKTRTRHGTVGRTTERADDVEAERRLLWRDGRRTWRGRRRVRTCTPFAPSALRSLSARRRPTGSATAADRATGARGTAGSRCRRRRRWGCTRARTFHYENSGGVRIIYHR